jgi:prephenate dehydrogenase
MSSRTLAIVGVGLIGGSIALAARVRCLTRHVVGVHPNPLEAEKACPKGIIDTWYAELGPAVSDADAVFVCTPVDQIANQVAEIAALVRPETWISDVGSTKAVIVKTLIDRLPAGTRFVGGHPLAGSEKNGSHFAAAHLFEDRLVVLTPSGHFHHAAVVAATAFWRGLGARVKEMTPEDHDQALAITSHLPHLAAAALAAMLPEELRELAASGFRDTTRVAGGDARLWTAILLQNQAALAEALAKYQQLLARCFDDGKAWDMDHLQKLLADGKRIRDALGS